MAPALTSKVVTPDSGYDYLNSVTVEPMPQASRAVPSVGHDASGLVTARTQQAAGYVGAGSETATEQLPTQAAKTVTPTKQKQTAVAAGKFTTGAVEVAAIPSEYVVPSGTLSIGANGTYDVAGYASAEVSVSGDDGMWDAIAERTLSGVATGNASFISNYAFYNCSALTTASFPSCTSIGTSAFNSCYNLTTASFPAATTIGSYAFFACSKLTTASFPAVTSIGNGAFQYCNRLTSLNLVGVSKVPLLKNSVFVSTPIGGYSASAGQYGSVYVPASLYESFLTATNWSSIASRIVSVA